MNWVAYYLRGNEARKIRKTSDSKSFPFTDLRVPIMLIQDGEIAIANSVADKLRLFHKLNEEDGILLGCWPGRHRQDVFKIDAADYIRMEAVLTESLKQ